MGLVEKRLSTLVKQPDGDLKGLLEQINKPVHLQELVMSSSVRERLNQVLLEQKDKLSEFGLIPRRKLLFTGPLGTGKTMSASVIATELKLVSLELCELPIDKIDNSYFKLCSLTKRANREIAILFISDAIPI